MRNIRTDTTTPLGDLLEGFFRARKAKETADADLDAMTLSLINRFKADQVEMALINTGKAPYAQTVIFEAYAVTYDARTGSIMDIKAGTKIR